MTATNPVTKSLGESRVGVSIDPSATTDVDDIKRLAADCIDWCNRHMDTDNPEVRRLLSLAMTHFEEAAMWAIKAA